MTGRIDLNTLTQLSIPCLQSTVLKFCFNSKAFGSETLVPQ
jgi:hypothetical protein